MDNPATYTPEATNSNSNKGAASSALQDLLERFRGRDASRKLARYEIAMLRIPATAQGDEGITRLRPTSS